MTALAIVTSSANPPASASVTDTNGVISVATINTALAGGSVTLSSDYLTFSDASPAYSFTGLSGATLTLDATGASGAGGFTFQPGQSISTGSNINLTLNGGATPLDLKASLTVAGGALMLSGTGVGATPGVKVEAAISDSGGAVTLDAGSTAVVTSAGVASGGGAIHVAGGSVTLGGDIDAATGAGAPGSVVLTSTNADISQTTGRVKGGALTATATGGGVVTLTNVGNTVTSAALSGASVAFVDGAVLTLTGAQGTAGGVTVTTSGQLTLAGAVTAAAGSTVRLAAGGAGALLQTAGVLTADTLSASAGGALTLNASGNAVKSASLGGASVSFTDSATPTLTLTSAQASTGNVSVTNSGALQTTTGGVTSTSGSVALEGSSIALGGATSAAQTATLTSDSGGISQTAAITAGTLSATATGGAVTLNAANMVANATLSGAGVSFTDGQNLVLTGANSSNGALTVTSSGALTTSGAVTSTASSGTPGTVSLTGGSLTLGANVSAGTGSVVLASTATGVAAGAITQVGGIVTAASLNVTATGAVDLGDSSGAVANKVGSAAFSGASVSFTDAQDLILSRASTTGGTLTVTTTGALSLAVNAVGAAGLTTLTGKSVSGYALALSGGAVVTATGPAASDGVALGALTLSGASPVTLTSTKGVVGLASADSATSGQGVLLVSATNGAFSSGALGASGALAAFGVKAQSATITGTSSVATLAATLTGSGQGFTLNDGSAALTVGTAAAGYSGLTTNGGASSLTSGSLAVNAAVNVGAGSLALTTTGAGGVSQSAAITAGTVTVTASGGGGATLGAAITTAGGLSVNTSGAATLSGSLTGTGGLTEAGAGTLTVQGANTYGGGTTISAGAVVAKAAGSLSTGAVSDATSLTYSGASGAVANAISGAGSLSVTGVGTGNTLTFSGALTQTGGFSVADASNVAVGSTGSYAAGTAVVTHGGTFTNAGAVTVSGDAGVSLASGGAVANLAGGAISASGTGVVAAAAATLTNAGSITSSGSDGVDLNGGGTVTNGSAAYSASQNAASTLDGEGTTGAAALYGPGTGAITLNNYGRVFSNQGSGVGLQGGAALTVNNFAGGVIYGNGAAGYFGFGAFDTAGALTVNNAGVIAGATNAIYSAAAAASTTITNSGTIETGTYDAGSGVITAALSSGSVAALEQLRLSNSGSVLATGGTRYAVFAQGDGSAVLNSGVISTASRSAVQGGAGLTVVNAAAGTLAGGSDAATGYAVEFAGGTGSFDTFGTANANGRGVTVSNTVDGSATGAGVTATLEAGSTTGALALGGQDDTVNLYTGAVTSTADTRTDPVSGASVVVRAAGTYGAAAFSTIALGGGTNALNLRGAGDGGANGAAASLTLSNVTGAGALTKLDAGAWTLTGDAAGSGLTRINAGNDTASGVLNFSNTSNLTAPIYVDGAEIVAKTAGAFGSGVIYAVDPTITFAASGAHNNDISLMSHDPVNDPTVLQNTSSGTVILGGAITQAAAGSTNTNGQTVAADQSVTIAGAHTIWLTNSADSWTGVTTINAGVTLLGTRASISGASITDNGVLAYADTTATLSQLISGSGALMLENGGTYTIAAGTADTYTGATTVSAGVLKLDGSLTSAVEVDAYCTLQGTGSTTGAVTVDVFGTFKPGEGAGTFTSASLSLSSQSTFGESITATGAGKAVATSSAAGAVSLGGVLSLTYTGGSAYGAVYTIVQETGGGTVTGTFSNAAEGATLTSGGHSFRVNYTSTAVTLTDLTDTAPVLGGSGASPGITDKATTKPLSAITVTDPDAGQTQTATVAYTAANGGFTGLGSASVAGGVATYTVTGAAGAVQTALRNAVFTPTADQVAPGQTVSTTFTVNDTDGPGAAATPAATATLTVTSVNDAPTLGGTHTSAVGDRATNALFSGVAVGDPDTGQTETATITYAASAGALSYGAGASGVTFAGAAGSYTLSAGSATALSTALQAVSFAPTATGYGPSTQTTFSLSVSDGAAATSTDAATVVTVSHATNSPVATGNATAAQAIADTATASPFAGVTVTDGADAGQTYRAAITYTAANGTLAAGSAPPAGAAITGAAGGYTVTADTAAHLQAALQALVFTPAANQVAPGQTVQTAFSVAVSDLVGAAVQSTTTVADTVTVTSVNDAPTLSGTHASSVSDHATVTPFSGATVADPDTGQGETVTVTLSNAANGALSGGGFVQSSPGVYTVTKAAGSAGASAAAAQAALQAAVFTPTQAPAGTAATQTTLSVQVSDGTAATATDSGTVVTATHTTNTPVQTANATPAQAITDKATVQPFAGVTVTDPDAGQTATATIAYTAANGVLSGAGLTGTAGSYTLSAGSAAALQAALQALVFTPTMNQVAPSQTVATSFGVSVGDGASTAQTSDIVTATSVNDAPAFGGFQASASATSTGSVVLQPTVTVTDPDPGATVSSAQVAITAGFVNGDQLTATPQAGITAAYNTATGVLTLAGAASDMAYQQTLETVTFGHTPSGATSTRTVNFTITDDGGASTSAAETVSVGAFVGQTSGGGGGTTLPTNLDAQQGYPIQTANLTRAAAGDPAFSAPMSPLYAQAQAEAAIAARLDTGTLSPADAQNALYHLVDGTTSVAEISYAFFTGKTPSAAGLDYLVHSSSNPTDLNDAYYAQFTTENRYINFANNLATGQGAGAAAFQANYGSLSLSDATAKAYAAIFGATPTADKVSAILNAQVSNGLGGTETRAQYFADITGGSAASQKAAAIGFLLSDSVKEGFGAYQQADLHFLADLAHGTAVFNVDLLAAYTQAPNLVGQPVSDPTLGS